MMQTRRHAASLVIAVFVPLAAGCGADETNDTADTDVTDTNDAGADATSDRGDDTSDTAPDTEDTADSDVIVPPPPSVLDYDVLEPGPYNTGYQVFETTYDDPATGAPRTIPVHIWYPTTDTEGEAAPYMGGLFPDEDSFVDATVAPPVDGLRYPTIVYSHGNRGFGGTSGFLMRAFASQGWVAIAPDHIGDLLTDGSTSETIEHWVQRPLDITAALDAVAALDDSSPLSLADVDNTVMFGHSRGCTTVWALLGATFDLDALANDWPAASEETLALFAGGFRDPRVVAGTMLACSIRGGLYGDTGHTTIETPVLALTGSLDGPEGALAQWERVTDLDFTWVELAGGCHQTFALGACETLDVDLGFRVVSIWSRAFARFHLLEDTDATVLGILDGTTPVSAVATVYTR